MTQIENKTGKNQIFSFLTEKMHWIATLLLLLGFIVAAIDSSDSKNGMSFHQLVIAPLLLLAGYTLFIFVIMRYREK